MQQLSRLAEACTRLGWAMAGHPQHQAGSLSTHPSKPPSPRQGLKWLGGTRKGHRGPIASTVGRGRGVSVLGVWQRALAQRWAGGTCSGPRATGQPWPCQGLGAHLPPLEFLPAQGPHHALGSLSQAINNQQPSPPPPPIPGKAVHAPIGEGRGARQRDRLCGSERAKEIKPSSAESCQSRNSAKEYTCPCVTAQAQDDGAELGGGW